MKNKLKSTFKTFGILALVDLVYLNILVLVALSFKQAIMIALEVVKISNNRGIELTDLYPKRLGELIELAIQSVNRE